MSARHDDLVAQIAERVLELGLTVAVAESLTSGNLASSLAAGQDAATWFRGGVVAYAPQVKFDLLGVKPGPVNCASCAEQMAAGTLDVLGCDIAISATGVGGPGPDEGVPAGTVFVALAARTGDTAVREHHFEGSPEPVIEQTITASLALLVEHLAHAAVHTEA